MIKNKILRLESSVRTDKKESKRFYYNYNTFKCQEKKIHKINLYFNIYILKIVTEVIKIQECSLLEVSKY